MWQCSALYAGPDSPFATLVVAHGAGAGMEHPFLRGFTDALNDDGVATLRFNFPYREAGRKFPDRPPAAIASLAGCHGRGDAAGSRHTETPGRSGRPASHSAGGWHPWR